MKTDEGYFSGAAGKIYWRCWLPENPRAVVMLIHGIAEHTGRYEHVAKRLVDEGYAVYGLDHHGHGRSDGTGGNIGSMAGVVSDVAHLRRIATVATPDVPVFVLGHSLGGLIALDYVTGGGQQGLAGLVLSGAAVEASVGSKLERKLAPVLSKIAPNLGVADLGIDNISRDPVVVQAYRDDPLVYTGKVRARTGAEGLAAMERVTGKLGIIELPLLILHGSEDKLADPSGAQLVRDRAKSQDKTVKIYDGLFHEIFNEPEQQTVLGDLVGWLDSHL
ncbi:MAG: lysophospholipase [Nocardioidaceae bacterium]|nr:MAG: lysophospholipase [Nocardioidaceae bacterium]